MRSNSRPQADVARRSWRYSSSDGRRDARPVFRLRADAVEERRHAVAEAGLPRARHLLGRARPTDRPSAERQRRGRVDAGPPVAAPESHPGKPAAVKVGVDRPELGSHRRQLGCGASVVEIVEHGDVHQPAGDQHSIVDRGMWISAGGQLTEVRRRQPVAGRGRSAPARCVEAHSSDRSCTSSTSAPTIDSIGHNRPSTVPRMSASPAPHVCVRQSVASVCRSDAFDLVRSDASNATVSR